MMKRVMFVYTVFSIVLCLGMTSIILGSTVTYPNDIRVILDDKLLDFDVQPQIIDGRTMVPFRAIFEAIGMEVEWHEEFQTIWALQNNFALRMDVGRNLLYVGTYEWSTPPRGGEPVRMHMAHSVILDVPPIIIDGRTLVPLRAIAEGIGSIVEWEGDTRTVTIISGI